MLNSEEAVTVGLSELSGGAFLLFPVVFLPGLTVNFCPSQWREVPEPDWWGSRFGEGWGEPSGLGSWRSESAGRRQGGPILACWGDGAGMFLQPEAWALPAASWLLLLWAPQPQLWLKRWEMPGALFGGFSQETSEAA